ncbi:restriction endonuclease subunit S [Finegoldia magna]|uniref:restriction endonuclease subunit S n=1 Tax=Finegoldia magna TaxID=1260 RepID=UPI0019D51AE1|nr:restriction endonuclease subunit S [Finegoldia magna]
MKSEESWGRLVMRYKLSDVMELIGGGTPKTSKAEYWNGEIPWLSVKDFNNDFRYVYETEKSITELGLNNSSTKLLKEGDIIISARGTVGEIATIPFPMAFNQSCYGLRAKEEVVTSDFLYYLIKHNVYILKKNTHGSVFDTITRDTFSGIEVDIPSLDEQRKIASILSEIDEKIELNNEINKNLEEQVLAIYNQWFEVNSNCNRQTCRAEEYFNIAIGKTPPRKESEWFSANPDDVTWVSISDMGSCGTYIRRSSEQLTKEAIERHNIKIVPDNTVLLSFKLTIGRIAITVGEMTTNEAIAHFKTNNTEITEYLYCYLKNFNYQTMGSTSSIATAVNSKIIKAMPFVIPTDEELYEFHAIAGPIFAMIKENQLQTGNLSKLRDSLLPKLMSGELDVSDIDL